MGPDKSATSYAKLNAIPAQGKRFTHAQEKNNQISYFWLALYKMMNLKIKKGKDSESGTTRMLQRCDAVQLRSEI
jgi:hypothetical protein